jgi:hypothetical protein
MTFGFAFKKKHWRARAAEKRERALARLSVPEMLALLMPPPRRPIALPPEPVAKAEPEPPPAACPLYPQKRTLRNRN